MVKGIEAFRAADTGLILTVGGVFKGAMGIVYDHEDQYTVGETTFTKPVRNLEIGWVDGEPVKAETDCEFRDGFLVTTRNVYGVPIGITYALLEDGTLSCVMELDGVEMTIIYEKTDAAAEEPAA